MLAGIILRLPFEFPRRSTSRTIAALSTAVSSTA